MTSVCSLNTSDGSISKKVAYVMYRMEDNG